MLFGGNISIIKLSKKYEAREEQSEEGASPRKELLWARLQDMSTARAVYLSREFFSISIPLGFTPPSEIRAFPQSP